MFINFSGHTAFQQFHGKAIGLDIKDQYVPFPPLFIIHEMCVRGFHPFQPVNPDVPEETSWQDWILLDGIFNHASGCFNHDTPDKALTQPQLQCQPMTMGTGSTSLGQVALGVIAEEDEDTQKSSTVVEDNNNF